MKPYGIISDTHHHNWSAFASVNEVGVNTRLQILLDELWRAAETVAKAGGNRLFHAGDLFHVRGSIAPSVLNPTKDLIERITRDLGIQVILVPGNHDMEHKQSNRVGNAVQALAGDLVTVANEPTVFAQDGRKVIVLPWVEKIEDLKRLLNTAEKDSGDKDIIIHAPIDGVIAGLPDHGLTAGYLASLGFNRVFAGHYHHHKDFGNGVYSIGASAHHTFSDVGTKAGFLLVTDGEVKWFKSHAPEFVDITHLMTKEEAELAAEGNYCRAKVVTSKSKEIEALREWLIGAGARGVVIQSIKEPARTREGAVAASVRAGASIEASIAEFVKARELPNPEQVVLECQKVLAEVA